MQLADFLKTVPHLTPQQKVDAAKVYPVTVGKILEATTFNGWLSAFKLLPIVKRIAENEPDHPAHSDLLAVWVALLGNHPINFKIGNVTGDGNIASLDRLITTDLTEHAAALAMLKQTALYFANTVTYPLVNTTLHDVLITLGECPRKAVANVNGWVTITTTADTPCHNPRLLARNPRTDEWQWANNFRAVSKAGVYDAQVPTQFLAADLAIDNAYGVM